MIEMRMYEMGLRQVDLARKLRVSPAKLSLILNGKQKADVDFLKAVHTELNIDANFILEHESSLMNFIRLNGIKTTLISRQL